MKPFLNASPVVENTLSQSAWLHPKLAGTSEEIYLEKFLLDIPLSGQLQQLAKEQGTQLYVMLCAVFRVLLHRHTNDEDIRVSSAFEAFGEPFVLDDLVNGVQGQTRFAVYLQQLTESMLEAKAKQAELLNEVQDIPPGQRAEKNHLFPTIFLGLGSQYDQESQENPLHLLSEYGREFSTALMLNESQRGIQGCFAYFPRRMDAATAKQMVIHFENLLHSIIRDPQQPIGALDMLSIEEQEDLLLKFNSTAARYDDQQTIVDLFEQQVRLAPDHTALQVAHTTIDYMTLNEKANRLAHYLIRLGIRPGDNIGLLASRGFDMIIGMYAIMKAGGAYVPIDPQYPLDRQKYILNQSAISLVLASDAHPLMNEVPENQFILMSSAQDSPASAQNPGLAISSRQLAYTIYTSGSTGRPKGVMIEHHSVINLIQWVNRAFQVGPTDRLLFITSMCFDLSVYDIFGILSAGGTVVIAKEDEVNDVQKLPGLLQEHAITFWDSVPTTMEYVVRSLENSNKKYLQETLRVVFLSGDWIGVSLPERIRLFFPGAKVISLGGATEGTIWSNYYTVNQVDKSWTSIPYGRPIINNTFYILNEQLKPVPIGVSGHLYIGGVGVARGYAGDPEKTDFAFIEDPFNKNLGGRMYRTGDLGRMLPDLNMEFIGRKDSQVKIRGFRVELGEIESVIRQSERVREVAVIAKEDDQKLKQLIVYMVPNDGFCQEALYSFLNDRLPEYMVPSLWVQLDALPLNSNGKIDKHALPPYPFKDIRQVSSEPRDQREKDMVSIWQDVLRVKVGTNDNFFSLGGHSLSAVQILSKIESITGDKMPLSILFKYPTVAQLYDYTQQGNAEKSWKSLVPIKTGGKKLPVYIVHGDGLNVLNISDLAAHMHPEQPVYGLQPKGLNACDEPFDNMQEIARHYVQEILEQNPSGPYALAGYSFGGFVAIEMRRQLVALGKQVKLLAIFDTNTDSLEYAKHLRLTLSRKMKRQLPKFLFITKSILKEPKKTASYQLNLISRKMSHLIHPHQPAVMERPENFSPHWEKIYENHTIAFRNYDMEPFDGELHLFKAKQRTFFVDDMDFLGWKKYANKGVLVHDVTGDHKTMLEMPHAIEFASQLQDVLDFISRQ